MEVKFTVSIPNIPELHQVEAEYKAKEAYVMTLLQHSDISSGKAAELLDIDRWQLSDLMDSYGISPFSSQSKEELENEITQARRVAITCSFQ
ncbi:UPF0175 family protein [Oculatella sp. FACHB-28]|uniref:UPF0175 family protein n=1 Tax=Oculatella sp. FACHB-28 TaxID=2692845 RepID=UPI001685D759|nr:UPF0175 family protein [Oculatella sp. FACHB-28]